MSLWEKIATRDNFKNTMEAYYQQKCQYQIRCVLAAWVEDYFKSEGDVPDNGPLFLQLAKKFVEALKAEIQRIFPAYTGIFETIGQYPEEEYYRHLRNGIAQELQLIRAPNMNGNSTHELTASIIQLNQGLPNIITTEESFRNMCDRLQTIYNEYNQLQMGHSTASRDLESRVQIIKDQYNTVVGSLEMLIAQIRQYIIHYETALNSVIGELKKWQRSQAYGGNGQPFRENLDEIQDWIEDLLRIINVIRDVINRILACLTQYTFNISDKYRTHLTTISGQILHLQENLIISSFIVEKQPPQVMKTNTRFASTVRWLIGQQLGISATNPQVECVILSETQAQRHFAQRPIGDCPPHSSGEITNNSSSMEFQPQSRHFTASFRNMQLKKIKRAEKKGTESVMDEKFALLFYTTTSFGNEYRIRAWTLSLPVVVIVHGNQEPQSWATITWDNAFAEITREPFQVPERVPWSLLSAALNTKFQSQTKRALTTDNMRFLCEKIFRTEFMTDDNKNYISWAQFCKEPLPERTFTFWDWFFAIMKLTKDHLLGPWQAGHIVGFINKRQTMEQMKQFQVGTFLLRFSDSELGGITIAWVKGGNEVLMLQPWTARDLNVRALADRVKDLAYLQYLYPNINKDDAFGGFYSPPGSEQRRDGYVRSIIIAHIPGYAEQPGNTSYPNTPQHESMQSPNHSMEISEMAGSSNSYNNYPLDDFDYLQDDVESNVNRWDNIMQ